MAKDLTRRGFFGRMAAGLASVTIGSKLGSTVMWNERKDEAPYTPVDCTIKDYAERHPKGEYGTIGVDHYYRAIEMNDAWIKRMEVINQTAFDQLKKGTTITFRRPHPFALERRIETF